MVRGRRLIDQLSNEHATPSSDPVFDAECRRPLDASAQFAVNNDRLLWRMYLRALELDLIERTPESRLLRTLAHRAWRDAFLAEGAAT